MSRAHDLAWCAGFFDGEGYVTIQRRTSKYKDKVYHSHYLRIGINHVAPEPLLEMSRVFGGKIKLDDYNIVGNRKSRHIWMLSCTQAESALTQMMPYFKNKNKAAELGLELQQTMSKSKENIGEDKHLYRELLKQELQTLNSLN